MIHNKNKGILFKGNKIFIILIKIGHSCMQIYLNGTRSEDTLFP